jgi:hypothetical protein
LPRSGEAAKPGARATHQRRLLQHPERILLARGLDDPRQHELPEHLITPGRLAEAEHIISTAQGITQMPHPRRGDLQRPASRSPGGQAEVELALPGHEPLPRRWPVSPGR